MRLQNTVSAGLRISTDVVEWEWLHIASLQLPFLKTFESQSHGAIDMNKFDALSKMWDSKIGNWPSLALSLKASFNYWRWTECQSSIERWTHPSLPAYIGCQVNSKHTTLLAHTIKMLLTTRFTIPDKELTTNKAESDKCTSQKLVPVI